jgi:DNA-binding FadR family transcriptional regulator
LTASAPQSARSEADEHVLKLSEYVTRALARRIVNGEFEGGSPPPTEQDICREFKVSKTTAREVIGALAARGLVTVRHGRRMQVNPVGEWNHLDPLLLELNDDPDVVRGYLADLHDVRMLLEPEIAARAALMASEGQTARMEEAVERMGDLEDDPEAYLEVDLAFHRELAAATNNVVLAFVLDSVRELLRVSRRVTGQVEALPGATQAHRQIIDAVAAREPEAARQAMRAHLLTVTRVWAPGSVDGALELVMREEMHPAAEGGLS